MSSVEKIGDLKPTGSTRDNVTETDHFYVTIRDITRIARELSIKKSGELFCDWKLLQNYLRKFNVERTVKVSIILTIVKNVDRIYSRLTLKLEQGNLARGTLSSLHQAP